MTEREQRLEELLSPPVALSRAEAERRLRDADLWLVEPELRDGLDGEDAITQWEHAVGFAECLERGFAFAGWADVATSQLIIDMRLRAEEALRRARQRVKDAQQSG